MLFFLRNLTKNVTSFNYFTYQKLFKYIKKIIICSFYSLRVVKHFFTSTNKKLINLLQWFVVKTYFFLASAIIYDDFFIE